MGIKHPLKSKNVYRTVLIFLLQVSFYNLLSQTTYQTNEVRLRYSNGIEVFNICVKNPAITYDEQKSYYWYTEFSRIKVTEGGSGGNLLHGNYKFYDNDGNLLKDCNYFLGLKDGESKSWDSIGNLSGISKYDKGKRVYRKFLGEDEQWIELSGGEILSKGVTRKIYSKFNRLLEEAFAIDDFVLHRKLFYEFSGKLHQEFTQDVFADICKDKFVSYYENGRIEVEGEYCKDCIIEIQTGLWKWYNPDGTLKNQELHKAEVIKYENGRTKSAGGYIFNEDTQQWLKTGKWVSVNEYLQIIDEREF